MTKPAMIHFISDIPEPAAYGANDLTKVADMKANRIYRIGSVQQSRCTRGATYRKEEIDDIVQEPKRRPVFPFRTTILSAPAAELLIQVEPGSTIPQLNIRQPLRDNIQQRRIQPNRRAHNCNNKPCLSSIVRLAHFPSPSKGTLMFPEPEAFSTFCSSPCLFVNRILHPVDRRKVFIALYFADFFCYQGWLAIVVGGWSMRLGGRRGNG